MRYELNSTGWLALLLGFCACSAVEAARREPTPGEVVYRDCCGRCHDPVAPRAYSDLQWRGVIGRMQPEAGLSDSEASSLLRWLQASN